MSLCCRSPLKPLCIDRTSELSYANKVRGTCSFCRRCPGNGSLTDWQTYSPLFLSDKAAFAAGMYEMRVELQYQPCHLLRGQGEGKYTVSITDVHAHTQTHTHPHTKFHPPPYVCGEIHINTCVHSSALFSIACFSNSRLFLKWHPLQWFGQ